MEEASEEVKFKNSQPNLESYLGSDQKKKFLDKIVVIADSREVPSQIINELIELGVTVELRTLILGDYILSDKVAVERKTSEDFTSSIIDGRLFNQAAHLKKNFEKPIIIIEGKSLFSSRNVRPEAIVGAVSSVLIDYQIPMVRTSDVKETALLLFSIAKREQKMEGKEPRLRGSKHFQTLKGLQEYIVAGLPNVDTTLAKRLLKQFKSIEKIFTASVNELMEVDGIGKKKSKKIKEILTEKYSNDEL